MLELLIAVALMAVITAWAMPGMQLLYANQQAIAAQNQLIARVQAARHAAVTAGTAATLCASVDRSTCGGDWSAGALAFLDRDGNRQRAANEPVSAWFGPLPQGSQVAFRVFGNRRTLQFSPTGTTRAQNGTFYWCPADGDVRHARAIVINLQGRLRVAGDNDRDGIREDASGRPLRCDGPTRPRQ